MAASKQPLSIADLLKRSLSRRAQRLSLSELRELKVCFWDIEASGLDADFAILLCAGIKTLGKPGVRVYRLDDSPYYESARWDDSWVAEQIRNDLEQHQVVVHHYGIYYDIPFLITRLLGHNRRQLNTSRMAFVDTWKNSRNRLKLHSNRLASLIAHLETPISKTGLDGWLWTRATAGDRTALDEIVKHNIHDVLALQQVTLKLARSFNLQYYMVK